MWRSAKLPRQQSPVPQSAGAEVPHGPDTAEPEASDPKGLSRNAPDGQQLLEELRGQPGFGVVMTSSEVQPTNTPQSLGQRLNHELDLAVRRERQVLELIDLANRPARELTPDQFRRLLESIS